MEIQCLAPHPSRVSLRSTLATLSPHCGEREEDAELREVSEGEGQRANVSSKRKFREPLLSHPSRRRFVPPQDEDRPRPYGFQSFGAPCSRIASTSSRCFLFPR